MALVALDVRGLALRLAGIFVFVVITVPFGLFYPFIMPDELTAGSIPFFVLLIMMACVHVYLFYRAYYALRFLGLLVFTVVYCMICYYFSYLLGLEANGGTIGLSAVAYLTLLYGYGVSYNMVDAFISGLLHTKSV